MAGVDAATAVAGSSGTAKVGTNGTTITVKAKELEPGHAHTMWVLYSNGECTLGESAAGDIPATRCGFGDILDGDGGVTFGDGKVAGGSGKATFSARLNVGAIPSLIGVPYAPGEAPDYHIVIVSHGPKLPGSAQIHGPDPSGGCDEDVFPDIPVEDGECGDVQLFIFETIPTPQP